MCIFRKVGGSLKGQEQMDDNKVVQEQFELRNDLGGMQK